VCVGATVATINEAIVSGVDFANVVAIFLLSQL
jgi:hypothetical protein